MSDVIKLYVALMCILLSTTFLFLYVDSRIQSGKFELEDNVREEYELTKNNSFDSLVLCFVVLFVMAMFFCVFGPPPEVYSELQ